MYRIAFCIRKSYATQRGGDVVQMENTKSLLERKHNCVIEIVTNPADLSKGFQIAHIFNLAEREATVDFFNAAKKHNCKIALSTIFWDYKYQAAKDIFRLFKYSPEISETNMGIALKTFDLTSALIQKPRIISKKFKALVKACLDQSDIILPNSTEELELVASFANLNPEDLKQKSQVVVNATNFDNGIATPENLSTDLPRDFILQVGRIEFIKNQLNVVRALASLPEIPIVFLGRINDEVYFSRVKAEAAKRGNVFFIQEVPHDQVNHFYKKAALHILPSFRESPGLVSLEALANGCKIVVSDKRFAPVDTYFAGIATIINPLSVTSIREGILKEMNLKRDLSASKSFITENFSWSMAADQTYAAYTKIANKEFDS